MRSQPSISVIVPFFNDQQHTGRCIDSLLQQQGLDSSYELISIINRPEDASASIVENAPRVLLLHEDNPGACAARTTGIRHGKAPSLASTDADCEVDTDWLRSIQESMRDPSLAVLVGHFRYPPEASRMLQILCAYENAKIEYVRNQGNPAFHFAYANPLAVRASVFSELGMFREWPRAADTELIHRLASQRHDLHPAYCRAMRVTHLEFLGARAQLARLELYRSTNSRVGSFQELTLGRRLATFGRMLGRDATL